MTYPGLASRKDAEARHQSYGSKQSVVSHRPFVREMQPALEIVHIAGGAGIWCDHCSGALLTDQAVKLGKRYHEGVMVVRVDGDQAATWETGEIGNRAACGPWRR